MKSYKADYEFFSVPVQDALWKQCGAVKEQARSTSLCARLLVYFYEISDKKELRKAVLPRVKEVTQESLQIPKALLDRAQRAITMSL